MLLATVEYFSQLVKRNKLAKVTRIQGEEAKSTDKKLVEKGEIDENEIYKQAN